MGFTNAAAVNVAGATTLASTLRVDGASDLRGAISNGGSATCGSTAVTGSGGSLCVNDAFTLVGAMRIAVAGDTAPSIITPSILGGLNIAGGNLTALTGVNSNKYVTFVGASGAQNNDSALVTIGETCGATTACTGAKAATFYGGGLAAFGNTHQTATISGAANLDPTSSRIILTCSTAASSFAVTMQETTVAATAALSFAHGADVTICSSPASDATCTLTFADVANVFEGSAPSLGRNDCFHMFYVDAADDLWLQDSPVQDN
jgi:hypothetical protein